MSKINFKHSRKISLSKKDISRLIEIYDLESNNLLNENIIKKIKSRSGDIYQKFIDIKDFLKEKFSSFISYLKANRHRIISFSLITVMNLNVIACSVTQVEDGTKYEGSNIEQIAGKYISEKDQGELFALEFVVNPDGTTTVQQKNLDTANVETGYVGEGYSLSLNNIKEDYSLEPIGDRFSNLLEDVDSGIFFYNLKLEKELERIASSVIKEFKEKGNKTLTTTRKISIDNKEITLSYFVSPESIQLEEANKFVDEYFTSLFKDLYKFVINKNISGKDYKEITEYFISQGTRMKSILLQMENFPRTSGFVIHVHEGFLRAMKRAAPTFIKARSDHEGKLDEDKLAETIRHETGHMYFDSELLSETIKEIVKKNEINLENKESSDKIVYSLKEFTDIILSSLRIDLKNEKIDFSKINGKKLYNKIPVEQRNRIKNFIITIFQTMIFSGKVKKEKYDPDIHTDIIGDASGLNHVVVFNRQTSEYMGRTNEIIQHFLDTARRYNKLEIEDKRFFVKEFTYFGKNSSALKKQAIKFISELEDYKDEDEEFKEFMIDTKADLVIDLLGEDYSKDLNRLKSVFRRIYSEKLTENNVRAITGLVDKLIQSFSGTNKVNDPIKSLNKMISVARNIDQNINESKSLPEVDLIAERVFIRLLSENTKNKRKYAGSHPDESYVYGWPEFGEEWFDADGKTTWEEDREWTKQYFKSMGLLK